MKRPLVKMRLFAVCAALIAAAAAVAAEGDLRPGSCIYSGDTNRSCTASAHLAKDIDFTAAVAAWVDDRPLDAFAFLKELQVLPSFRSDEPKGLFLIVR